MNDRYLFKAKRIDNFSWVQGNLIYDGETGKYFIHARGNSVNESDKVNEEGCLRFVAYEVDPSTICQCTGIKDKNGNLIYENDIVETPREYNLSLICWSDTKSRWEIENEIEGITLTYPVLEKYWSYELVVYGNKIDNPELLRELKGEDNNASTEKK